MKLFKVQLITKDYDPEYSSFEDLVILNDEYDMLEFAQHYKDILNSFYGKLYERELRITEIKKIQHGTNREWYKPTCFQMVSES